MSKRLRNLLVTVAVLIVAVLGLRIAATRLVPTESIRRQTAERIREATGAEVEIADASVRLLPRLGLRMSGALNGTGADLARATGSATDIVAYAAEVEELSVQLKPMALLRGRIETGPLRLACPAVRLVTGNGELVLNDAVLDVHDVRADFEQLSAAGSPSGPGIAPGEALPEDLAAAFRIRADEVLWQGARYEHFETEGELDMRVVSIDRIDAVCGGGTIAGNAEIDYDRDPWGFLDLEFEITGVPAVDLLEPWAPDLGRKLDCALSGEVSGGCELRDAKTILSTLDLTGRLHGGEGVLHAREWLTDIAPYLGARQDLQDVRIASLEHTFRLTQGRYRIEELELQGPDTDWTGEGWVGLDGAIDADLKVKLPAGFTPDLGQLSFLADGLRDEEGRVNLTLHLSGRSEQPDVGLKLAAGSSERKGAEDALKKGVGGFLDKLKAR